MLNNQKSGDNSTNLQASRDIVINNTIVLNSTEDIAKQLINSTFHELPDETKKQIETNQKSYIQALTEELKKLIKQNDEFEEIISSPDFQYVSKNALISASRSSSVELHKNLSSLITQRINNDSEDLKRIVYNEAILTINKLTKNELKILTLCFLLKRTKMDELTNIDQFIQYLEQKIKPFIDFKNTTAEFEHIVYTSCASISIESHDINSLLQENYPEIFKENITLTTLLPNNETAKKLTTTWENTKIKNMNLTSVGIAIASTFYEQITLDRIDINFWIN